MTGAETPAALAAHPTVIIMFSFIFCLLLSTHWLCVILNLFQLCVLMIFISILRCYFDYFYSLIDFAFSQENIFVYVGRQNECHVFSFAEDGYALCLRQNNETLRALCVTCAFFSLIRCHLISVAFFLLPYNKVIPLLNAVTCRHAHKFVVTFGY